jgi:DNA-binding GntR family transcriptional regulator
MSTVNAPLRLRRGITTPDVIAEALREEILRGDVAPGQALRQEELAERFGVSRLPVRDALLRLEAQGLVHVYPNRGAFVVSLSADEVAEIYEMRILLEGDIIERAVPKMTPEHWRRIDSAHAAATRTAGGPEWIEGDWRFHRTLYEAAARPRQLTTIENLRSTVARYSRAHDDLPAHTPDWLADHDAILEACRARAAVAAKQRLVRHLERALASVLATLG